MEGTQDTPLVYRLMVGCKPYSAVAILKSRSEMSEPIGFPKRPPAGELSRLQQTKLRRAII